jgi:hypothetical protein
VVVPRIENYELKIMGVFTMKGIKMALLQAVIAGIIVVPLHYFLVPTWSGGERSFGNSLLFGLILAVANFLVSIVMDNIGKKKK